MIGSVHGGKGRLSGYTFENITVEGPVFRPFGLAVQKNKWGHSADGEISGVAVSGVTFEGAAQRPSIVHGADGVNVRNVRFLVVEDGRHVSGADRAFAIDRATTENITFG